MLSLWYIIQSYSFMDRFNFTNDILSKKLLSIYVCLKLTDYEIFC